MDVKCHICGELYSCEDGEYAGLCPLCDEVEERRSKRKFTHFVGHCIDCGLDFPIVAECNVCDNRMECLLKIRPSCVPDRCFRCQRLHYYQSPDPYGDGVTYE